jgi:hypothetical protein
MKYPDPTKVKQILSWARYLYFADLARRNFDEFAISPHDVEKWPDWWRFFALMSQWYAAEYVVIEGWRDVRLQDKIIDEMLNRCPDLVELLRRYRNGVFHYQPKLIEPRFTDFLLRGDQAVEWIHYLHGEFERYYWSLIKELSVEDKNEVEESFLDIVGWIPDNIPESKAESIEALLKQAETITLDYSDPKAEEIKMLVTAGRQIIKETINRARERTIKFLEARR